jgi:methionyl-tRNA formyltransferase
VLHASDLPYGRGWSPHIWSILHGNTTVTVSAITAEDNIDSGDIWAKKSFDVAPHELYDEINTSLFAIEIDLLNEVIEMIDSGVSPHPQPNKEATYFPRRTPEDSELDPDLTIAEQFDKIRVGDPERYPAFFRMHGKKYAVSLRKVDNDE